MCCILRVKNLFLNTYENRTKYWGLSLNRSFVELPVPEFELSTVELWQKPQHLVAPVLRVNIVQRVRGVLLGQQLRIDGPTWSLGANNYTSFICFSAKFSQLLVLCLYAKKLILLRCLFCFCLCLLLLWVFLFFLILLQLLLLVLLLLVVVLHVMSWPYFSVFCLTAGYKLITAHFLLCFVALCCLFPLLLLFFRWGVAFVLSATLHLPTIMLIIGVGGSTHTLAYAQHEQLQPSICSLLTTLASSYLAIYLTNI